MGVLNNKKLETYMSNKRREWEDEMISKGHTPLYDEEGNLDVFKNSVDIHNGPQCTVCSFDVCWHCSSIGSIPLCTGAT